MTSFDYERSIWGKGTARKEITDATSIRFRNIIDLIKDLNIGSRVLEVGCGAGQFIRGVKKYRPELDCYGSDISEEAIKEGSGAKDGVKYFQQSEQSLPFEDGYFDAVLIMDVLEHTKYWKEILREAKRVLNNNGLLYIFVPCEGDRLSIWNFLRKIGVGADLTKKYAGHINYFKTAEVIDEVKKNSFEVKTKFSEHLLGQLLGIGVFFAMNIKAGKNDEQINNESYFLNGYRKTPISFIKKFVNASVFIESSIFKNIPSPNLHIFAKRTK